MIATGQRSAIRCGWFAAFAVAVACAPAAPAATLTWGTSGTGGDGTWSDVGAWYDGIVPQTWSNATPDAAVFAGTGGTVTLTESQTTSSITFDAFTGTFTIGTAGQTLVIGGGGMTMNAGAGAVTLSSPVTLGAAQTWTNNSSSLLSVGGTVTNGGNLLTVDGSGNTTISGVITGAGGLAKLGSGTTTLTGANTYSGTASVTAGTLVVQNAALWTQARTYAVSPGAVLELSGTNFATGSSFIQGAGTLRIRSGTQLNNAAGPGRSITMGMGSGGLVDVQSSGTFVNGGWQSFVWTSNTAALNVNGVFDVWDGNAVQVDALTGAGTVTKGISSGTLAMTVGFGNGSGTFSGVIQNPVGVIALTKAGSGTQTLTGANTYTGATTINAGTLRIGNGGTVGSLSASTAITGSAGGTLAFNRTDNYGGNVANTIGGAVNVVLNSGTLRLTGLNTSTGTTSVNAGSTLVLASSASRSAGVVGPTNVLAGGTLNVGAVATGPVAATGGGVITTSTLAVAGLTGLYTPLNSGGPLFASLSALDAQVMSAGVNLVASSSLAGANFDFGNNGSGFPAPYNSAANNFVGRWSGQFNATTSGTYTFFTSSDDGSVIFINGNLVVNNNYAQPVTERSGTIVLTPGWHDIVVGFNQGTGGWGLSASVTAPGGSKALLSNSLLRSAPVVSRLESDSASSLVVGDAGLMVTQTTATVVAGPSSGTGMLSLLLGGTGNVLISGSTSLSRFYVGPATASNVTQGLTISGAVAGSNGLQMTGPGTLVLTNTANSFTGPITVGMTGSAAWVYGGNMSANPSAGFSGFVAATSDAALGAAANQLVLGNGAGLRAMGTFSTARTIQVASGTSWTNLQVTAGNTLTFTGSLANTGSFSQLIMSDNGRLRLPNAGPASWSGSINSASAPTTLTGGLLVSSGVVEIANGSALGSPANIAAVSNQQGAAIALTGGITVPNAFVLNTTNSNPAQGLYSGFGVGTLVSESGVNTVSGSILINQDTGIGASAGATLNLTGTVALNAHVLSLLGPGSINISGGGLTGVHSLYKLGSGTATITTSVAAPSSGGVRNLGGGGLLVFSGTGAVGTNSVTNQILGGGELRLDNSGTNVVNRLGGTSPLLVSDGTLRFVVSSTAASSESFGTLTAAPGATNIVVETTGSASTLTFGGLASNAVNGGGTLLFRAAGTGANFGTASNSVVFSTAPTLTPNVGGQGILARGLVVDGNGWNFATYGNGASLRAFTAYDTTNLNAVSAPTTSSTATVQVASSVTLAGNRTINGLKLTGGGLTLGGVGSTLTLTSGGILATGGTSTIGSGIVLAAGATEVGLNASDDAVLTIGAPITTSGNITRGGGGVVNITAPIYAGATYALTGGTTRLTGGDAMLYPGQGSPGETQNLAVSSGAVLDLAGSAQLVGQFAAPNNNNYAGTAGTITSAEPALFAVRNTTADRYFGGQITGAITNVQAGSGQRWFLSDNTYTGRTAILSGNTVLSDAGRLSATAGIDINFGGGLRLLNNGQFDIADRVPTVAPITMRGGYLEYQGRAQTASAETLGAVTLAAGVSDIQVIPGGTGVNSAVLTLTSLTPAGGVLNVRGSTLGQPGSTGRLLVATNESAPDAGLVNNMLSAAVVVGGADFASYRVGLGVAALGQSGYPAYDGTVLSSTNTATQNIKLAAGGAITLPAGGLALNSLVASQSGTVSFSAATDVLNLTSGGLLRSGNTLVFGASANSGRITAGGASPTGTSALYVHSNNAGGFTINSQIINNGGSPVQLNVNLYNSGVVTLSGSNSYTGGTIINGWLTPGSLSLAATGYIPAGGVTLNDATLTQTAGGIIDPTNVVTLNGPAVLTLVGANTLSGLAFNNQGDAGTPTVTTGGALTLSSGTAITATSMNPSSIATVNGTLDFGGGARTFAVSPVAYDGRTFAPYTPTLNIGGVIQNAGQITVTGGGLLQVAGASTFTGGYAVDAGSGLVINASSSPTSGVVTSGPLGTGTLALASGARLLSGGNFTVANAIAPSGTVAFEGLTSLTLSGNVALPVSGVFDVIAPQPTLTLSGTLTGAGSTLVKNGYGILSLTGSNTFDGGVTVNRGRLSVGNAQALGTGTLTMSGGALDASVAGLTLANAQVWNGSFGFVGTQSLTTSGPVTLAQDSTLGVTGTLTVSGPIGDGGAGTGLTKAGNGVLVLSGTNTYGGTTTVAAGVLSIAGTAALPGDYTATNGAALVVPNAVNDTDSITLAGQGTFTSGGYFGFDTSAGDRTFAGSIANPSSGPLNLTKIGGNTLVLSNANTFTGTTTVRSGTLRLANSSALGSSTVDTSSGAYVFDSSVTSNAFTVAALAGTGTLVLRNNAATPAPITLTIGGDGSSSTYSGALTGSGSLVKTGAGTLTLTGVNTLTGTTTVAGGAVALNAPAIGPLSVGSGATLETGWAQGLTGLYTPPGYGTSTATIATLSALDATLNSVVVGPAASSALPGANFDFGGTGAGFPGTYPSNTFAARWTGQFNALTSGTYTFFTASDDGSMLWINGTNVVNNNFAQGVTERSGTIVLAPGWHDIVIGYFDSGGGRGLYANYTSPFGTKTLLPNSLLRSTPVTTSLSGEVGSTLAIGAAGLAVNQPLFTDTTFAGSVTGSDNPLLTTTGSGRLTLSGPVASLSRFFVSPNAASNTPGGLVISGSVSGTGGIVKSGTGTLTLSNPTNTFTGDIAVLAGWVATPNDGALGDAANRILVSNSSGFRGAGTFTTAREIVLGAGSTTLNLQVVGGSTMTFTGSFTGLSGTTQILMSDNGTLRLASPGPLTWSGTVNNPAAPTALTGGMLVTSGTLEIANDAALGSLANVVAVTNQTGAVIALPGGITLPNQVVLNASGGASADGFFAGNGLGTLVSTAGTNTVSGLLNMNTHSGVGAAAGATLNITGGAFLNGDIIAFNGPGTINVSGSAFTGSGGGIYKLGSGTTTITTTVVAPSSVGVRNYGGGGLLVFSGTGAVAATSQTDFILGGGGFRLDNSAVNVVNRLGGASPLQLSDGTLQFAVSPTAASVESLQTLTAVHGYTNIVVETTGQASTLNFSGLASNAVNGNGTLLFRTAGTGANFGTAANTVQFSNAPTLSPNLLGLGIMSRGLVVDGNGWNFATYSQGSIRAFTAYDTTNLNAASAPTTGATATVQVGSSVTLAGNRTINGLKLTGGGVALGGAGSTLTLTSGGILATGGTSTITSGIVLAAGGTEVGLNASDDAVLTVGAPITTTSNITRGGGGVVNVTAPLYTSAGGWYSLTGGTTRLVAGDATLFPGQGTPGETQNLSVSSGAVLDLAGSAQLVGRFSAPNNNNFAGTAGTVTSDTPALFAVRTTANNIYFGGQITGAITNVQAGSGSRFFLSDNTYTGRTAILSGNTVLSDAGRLSATAGIDINFGGGLRLLNNGQFDIADRVPTVAPITMRGGYLEYQGRAQTASAETLGAVTLAAGWNAIQSLTGGTGVNSADLVLTSIAPATGSGAVLRIINANGQLGSNARILATAAPTLTNGIVPWAVRERDLVGYVPGLGFGALGSTGFPAYGGALVSGSNPTVNASNGATSTTLTANSAVNAFYANYGNSSPTLNLGGFTLTVGSGALMLATGNDNTTYTISSGTLTAGAAGVGGPLYLYQMNYAGSNRRIAIGAGIADNAGGPVQLVLSSNDGPTTGNTTTLSGSNTYSGGTVVNNGVLVLGGAAGQVVLPAGGVTLNGGGLTLSTNGGQINPANVVTLNGPSQFTLVSSNTLSALVFNNDGSSTTPTVTTGGALTLTSGTAITATSMNPQTIATVSGTLDFGGGARTFAVSPVAYDGRSFAPYTASLNIGGVITNAGQITVTGGGLLQVTGASTFTGGYSVDAGSGLYINASSSPTSGVVTSGPLGTGTLALTSGARLLSGGNFTVANAIAPSGTVSFEGINGLTLSGNVALPASGVFDVVAPQPTLALTGTLSGVGSALVKNGYGILSLTAANTFDGGVTVNRGRLSVGNAQALGTGTLTMAGGALDASVAGLTVANPQVWNGGFGFVGTQSLTTSGPVTLAQDSTLGVTGTLTVNGPIADGGSNTGLTKSGNGVLVLGGTNTYGGTTTVAAGVLSIAGTAALPGWDTAGRYAVSNGAAIAVPNAVGDATVTTMLTTGNFASGGQIGFDTTAASRTWSTALTGGLGVAKIGTNGLVLSASNSFTGPTTVYSGSISLQNQFAVQNSVVTVNSGASLFFDQAVTARAYTAGGLAGAGTVSLVNGTSGAITLTVGGANATTSFAGTLSGAGGLVKVGSGTQTLAGGGITYTGTTTVSAGTLYLNDTTGYNSPTIVNAGATLVTGGVATDDMPAALTLDGGTYTHATTSASEGWRVMQNLVTIGAGGGTINLDNSRGSSAANNNNVFINGGLAGSGTLTINATNMYGTNNGLSFRAGTFTFTGPTIVNSGIVWINGAPTALAGSDVTLNAAGNLRLDTGPSASAGNGTLKSLSGSGTVTLGSQTLTVGNNNGTGSFSGMIQGAGSLTKLGTGTQTLSGSTTFAGTTTVSAGRLVLANTFALQNSTLDPAASVVFDQSVSPANFTIGGLTGSGSLALQNNAGTPAAVALTTGGNNGSTTFSGSLTGAGSLTKVGNGRLTLSGSNAFAGSTTLSAGQLRLSSSNALPGGIGAVGGTGNLVLSGGLLELAAGDFSRPLGTGAGAVQFTGTSGFAAIGANRTVNLGGAGAEVTWGAGSFVPDGSALVLSGAAADSTLTFTNPIALGSGTRTVQIDNGTAIYDAVLSGGLSGEAALVKSGAGKLVLSATNTFAGGLTVSAGLVSVSSTAALPGWNVAGRNVVASNAALVVGNAVSDADAATILASGSFVSGANFGFDTDAGDRTFAGVVGGGVGLVKSGTGTLTLTNVNTYSGSTQILTGTLAITGTGSLGNGSYAGTIANAGTIVHASSVAQTLSGVISGSGGIQKTGAATLTLSAANTLSGTVAVSQGTLALNNVNALQNATLDTGAIGSQQVTFTVAGTNTYVAGALAGADDLALGAVNSLSLGATNLGGTFSGVLSGSAVTKNGSGTQVFDGPTSNTFTGVLTLGGNGMLGLAKTGGAVAAPGNVNITPSASRSILYTLQDNQFGPTSVINFTNTNDGRFELKGTTQTIGGLVGASVNNFVQHSEFAPGTNVSGTSTLVINVASGTGYSFAGTLRNQGGTMALTKLGSGTQTLQGSSIIYTGTTNVLGGRLIALNTATAFDSSVINVGSGAVLEFSVTSGTSQLNGQTLTGSGTIVKSGAGDLWWGANGSALNVNLSAGALIDIQGGRLRNEYLAGVWTNNRASMTIGASGTFAVWDANTTIDALNGSGLLEKGQGNTHTFAMGVAGGSGTFTGRVNVAAGTIALAKIGTGTQVLAGTATYTGATTATVTGGVLELDFANHATGTNMLATATPLTLNGGTLRVKGKATGATTQTVNGATLQVGGGGVLVNPAGGTSTTVALGALTTSNAGGSALVGIAPGAGAGTGAITTTTTLPATGVYSPRIVYTNGSTYDWATTTTTTPFVLSALASGSYVTLAAAGTDTNQSLLTAGATLSGALTTNTLKISDPAAGQTLALASATTTLTGGGLLLTGSNAFAISSGTLTAGNGSGAFDLIVHQYSSGTLTIGSAIVNNATNATAFTKAGPGTLLLTGSSTYSGITSINSGTLILGGAGQLGASASYSGAIDIATGGALVFNTSANQTLGGVISGPGSLLKSGSNTLTLSGANTFTGKTTIIGGTVSIAADNGLGAAPGAAVADQLTIDGGALRITAGNQTLATNRGITLGTAGGTIDTSSIAGEQTTTIAGVISGTGPLTLRSTGNQSATGGGGSGRGILLTGANTFTGSITVATGLLSYASDAALGNAANQIVLTGGGLLDNASNITMTHPIVVSSGTSTFRLYGSAVPTWSGAISGGATVNRTDGGTLTLTGNLSAFTGTYDNQGGATVLSGSAAGLGAGARLRVTTSTVTFSSGRLGSGTAVMNGGTLRWAAGNTDGNVNIALVNGVTATFDTNGNDVSLANGFGAGTSGGIAKTGSGTLVLLASSPFSGSTTITGGTLQIGVGGTTGSIASTSGISVGSGAALVFSRSDGYGGPYAGAVSGSGSLRQTGGTLTLTGSSTYTGPTTVTGGTLRIAGTGVLGGGTYANAIDVTGGFEFASSATQTLSGAISGSTALVQSGGGQLTLSGSNSYTQGTTIASGTVRLGGNNALPAGSTVSLGTGSTSGVLAFNSFTATLSGLTFTGADNLVGLPAAAGKLNLLAAGTNAATIQVNSGASAIHPDTTLQSNTVIDIAPEALLTLHGVIDGTGSLTKIGTGTLSILGANTYSGGSYLEGGYVNVFNTGALGSGTVTIAGDSILNLNNTVLNNAVVFGSGSGAIINSGALVNISGTYTITGGGGAITTNYNVVGPANITFASDIDSTVDVQSGALGTFSAGVLPFGTVEVFAGGAAQFDGPVNGNVLSSGSSNLAAGLLGNLTVQGGTTTIAGLLDSDSALNVNAGLAVVTGTIANIAHATQAGAILEILGPVLSTADVNAEEGATVKLMGSGAFDAVSLDNDGIVIVDRTADLVLGALMSGSGSLTKLGANTLSLTGDASFTGPTTVTGGTLQIGNGGDTGALGGTSGIDVADGAVLAFARTDDYGGAFDRVVSGSGGLRLASGTLVLSASNAYTGATVLAGGVLEPGDAGALGAGGAISFAGGTLRYSAANAEDYSARFSQAASQAFAIDTNGQDVTFASALVSTGGSLVKSGSGTLVLSAANAYTGATTIADGTLRIGADGSIRDSSGVSIASNSRVVFDRTDAYGGAYAQAFTGQGGLSLLGGALTLTASNSFTGSTLISGGTLALGSAAALDSGLIRVGAGAYFDVAELAAGLELKPNQMLGGNGTVLGDVLVAAAGILAPGASTGTLANTGVFTFGPDGFYDFELNDAGGTAGSTNLGWDLLTTGSLAITATEADPFTFRLRSLDASQQPGLAAFDSDTPYAWLVVDAIDFIDPFNPAVFAVDATNFLNETNSSRFSVKLGSDVVGGTADQLYIVYVPEPGSVMLAGIGLAAACWTVARRRGRRRAAA